MIKVNFDSKDGSIIAGEISGHAGYAEENDIVCASVSAVAFAVFNGIENVVGVDFDGDVRDGFLSFTIPDDLDTPTRYRVDDLLDTLYLYLVELERQYKENIKVSKTEV